MEENKKEELVSMEEQIGKPLRNIAIALFLLGCIISGLSIGLAIAHFTR